VAHSKVSKTRVLAAERRIQALSLRKKGLTYAEIGKELGCTSRRARSLVAYEFVRLKGEQNELAEEAFRTNIGRLDQLLEAVWHEALEGELEAVDTALKILDRQSRMMGLDAPARSEVQVTRLAGKELEEEARRLGLLPPVTPPQQALPAPIIEAEVEMKCK
jgi:hypothetical protein